MKTYNITYTSFHLENGVQENTTSIEARSKKEAIDILTSRKMVVEIKKVDIKKS